MAEVSHLIAHPSITTMAHGLLVNPNLYEEGKVCLSILDTWVGDQSESWSAAHSSLLQAFVSIQGLVLVKEPWFCEPAFDKLRGTQEGTVNRYDGDAPRLLSHRRSRDLAAGCTTRRPTFYREDSSVAPSKFRRAALKTKLNGCTTPTVCWTRCSKIQGGSST